MSDEPLNEPRYLDETMMYRLANEARFRQTEEWRRFYQATAPGQEHIPRRWGSGPHRVIVVAANHRAGMNVATLDLDMRPRDVVVVSHVRELDEEIHRGAENHQTTEVVFVSYPHSPHEAMDLYHMARGHGFDLPHPEGHSRPARFI